MWFQVSNLVGGGNVHHCISNRKKEILQSVVVCSLPLLEL